MNQIEQDIIDSMNNVEEFKKLFGHKIIKKKISTSLIYLNYSYYKN